MENGLLRYALFSEHGNESGILGKINHKNNKNEAAASRILIR